MPQVPMAHVHTGPPKHKVNINEACYYRIRHHMVPWQVKTRSPKPTGKNVIGEAYRIEKSEGM